MRFHYSALNRENKRCKGQIEAEDPRTARQLLREQSLQVLTLRETRQRTSQGSRLPSRALVLMMRQLATLTGAGLPLAEALQILVEQSKKPLQRSVLAHLRQRVLEGSPLAEAMADHPRIFTPLYRAMISAGEASGRLDRVLEHLAEYCEQTQQLKSKLLQSMVYPVLLMTVALIVVAILLTAVVPEIVDQFSHMQQGLPTSTRLLMTLSGLTQQYGAALLLLLSVLLLCASLALRKPALRMRWHQQQLALPLVGRIVLNLNLARYARTLSILTNSAVPLLEGMTISAAVLGNDFIRQRLEHASLRVREGMTLSQALEESALLPPVMQHMIGSGERSGELDAMLKRSADIQDNAFISQMTLAVSLFEPLLIVVMAAVVLFIILAILQPILQLNSLTG